MMQSGFFDLIDRYAKLDELGDPLAKIDAVVDWRKFRPTLKKVRHKPRKSNAGRPPFDELLMFKALVLQSLYNLSDEQLEFLIRDRYSFCRFLGLSPEGRIPDAKTVWLFREALQKRNLMEKLFDRLLNQIEVAGYLPRMGQIVDASIVEAPRQRNSRDENKRIKSGDAPTDWSEKKKRQKDVDARWTKKHGNNYYGYKNHVSVDRKHKVIRRWSSSSSTLHDGAKFGELLDGSNSSRSVWGDSAYWSGAREEELRERGYRSRINHQGRGKPMTDREKEANRKRSRVRARVEHVFGMQASFGVGKYIRTIGLARARLKIGMMNLAYNLKRFVWLAGHVQPPRRQTME